jgi:thymidylate synthase (FAD)
VKIIDQHYTWEYPYFGGFKAENVQMEKEAWARGVLTQVERAGRTCYKSEPQGDPSAFVRKLAKMGHHSVLEHAHFSIRFVTDRGVTHELVRHRLAAYSQESTRYCDYSGEMEFIRPVWCDLQTGSVMDKYWELTMQDAEKSYHHLRQRGWSPQQARAVLPNSLKTEIVMTANLREWRHVLALRASKAAHPQIRELMIPLLKELQGLLPELFLTLPKSKEFTADAIAEGRA